MVKKNPASENLGANIKLLGDLAWYVKRLYYNFLVEQGVRPRGGLCVGTPGACKWGRNLAHLSKLQDCFILQGLWEQQVELRDHCRCRSNRRTRCLEWEDDLSVFNREAHGWMRWPHPLWDLRYISYPVRQESGPINYLWDLKSWHLKRIKQHPHTTLVLQVSSWGIWKRHAQPVVAESADSELASSVLVLAPGSPTPPYSSFSHRSKTYVPLSAHLFSHLLTGTVKLWDRRNGEQMSSSREECLILSQTRNINEIQGRIKYLN